MADRRRRRRNSSHSDSECSEDEETEVTEGRRKPVRESECESEAGAGLTSTQSEADLSEYDETEEGTEDYTETETETETEYDDSVIIEDDDSEWLEEERQSGDGEEQPEEGEKTGVDDDEDRKNPAYIPRKGAFYEHDTRVTGDMPTDIESQRPLKKLWKDDGKWLHDRFSFDMQGPKSPEEMIAEYGFDIRTLDHPPDGPLRRAGRGRRPRGGARLGDYINDGSRNYDDGRPERSGNMDRGRGMRGSRGRGNMRGGYNNGPHPNNGSNRGGYNRGPRSYSDLRGDSNQNYEQPSYHMPPSNVNSKIGPPPRQWTNTGYHGDGIDNRPERDNRNYEKGPPLIMNSDPRDMKGGGDYKDSKTEYNNTVMRTIEAKQYEPKTEALPASESLVIVGNATSHERKSYALARRTTTKHDGKMRGDGAIEQGIRKLHIGDGDSKMGGSSSNRNNGSYNNQGGGQRSMQSGGQRSPGVQGQGQRSPGLHSNIPPRLQQQQEAQKAARYTNTSVPPPGAPPGPQQQLQQQQGVAGGNKAMLDPQTRPKRYSSQRQRGGQDPHYPEAGNEGPLNSVTTAGPGTMVTDSTVTSPSTLRTSAPPFFVPTRKVQGTNVYAPPPPLSQAPPQGKSQPTSPHTSLPPPPANHGMPPPPPMTTAMYRPDQPPPPHTMAFAQPVSLVQQPVTYTMPPATSSMPSPPRMYNPPPVSIASANTSIPPPPPPTGLMRPAGFIAATIPAPIVNYNTPPPPLPPPGQPAHYQLTGHVPLQSLGLPPPPPPPVPVQTVPQDVMHLKGGMAYYNTEMQHPSPNRPIVAEEEAVHIKGGTMYFNPELQPPSVTRSPARRPKAAIPIVNPQAMSYASEAGLDVDAPEYEPRSLLSPGCESSDSDARYDDRDISRSSSSTPVNMDPSELDINPLPTATPSDLSEQAQITHIENLKPDSSSQCHRIDSPDVNSDDKNLESPQDSADEWHDASAATSPQNVTSQSAENTTPADGGQTDTKVAPPVPVAEAKSEHVEE